MKRRFLLRLQWIVLLVHLVFAWGCASMPRKSVLPKPELYAELQARFPHATVKPVCAKPNQVPWDADVWVYISSKSVVVYSDPLFALGALGAPFIYIFDPIAPPRSVDFLQIPDNHIDCKAWLEEKIDNACAIASFEQRPDPRLLAQSEPVLRSPFVPPRGPVHPPSCSELKRIQEIQQINERVKGIGHQYGVTLGNAEEAIKIIDRWSAQAFSEKMRTQPGFAEPFMKGLAEKLAAIPDTPTYDDPEHAGIALRAFEEGFEAGIGDARRRFAALELAATAAHLIGPGVIESLGSKALAAMFSRLRGMPIFVPGATSGVGIFMRRAKPPPPVGELAPPQAPPAAKPAPPAAKPAPPTEPVTRTVTRDKATGATITKSSSGTTTQPRQTPANGQFTPRNAHLAGKVHPKTKVPFDKEGYPDFRAAGVVKTEVKIKFSGDRQKDVRAANKLAQHKETPDGYTWHHHQDGSTMQLIPEWIHQATGHTGGFAFGR